MKCSKVWKDKYDESQKENGKLREQLFDKADVDYKKFKNVAKKIKSGMKYMELGNYLDLDALSDDIARKIR